jgi:cytochrome b6-f complex iron-sulfur subunit
MDNSKTSRREFCAHAISLVTVASLIEGCGGNGNPAGPGGGGGGGNVPALPTVQGTAAGNTITVNNVSGTALANVGSGALVNNSVLVTQTAPGVFSAFTSTCTHEQCTITGFQSGAFVCPCHGSQYNSSGAVQQGPATRALQRFTTQFTNNVLTITV